MQNRFVVLSMKVSIRLWVSFLLCWSWALKYIAIRLIIVFSTTFQSITFALQNHHRWDKQQRFIEHYEILYRDKKKHSFENPMYVINSKRALSYLKGYHKKSLMFTLWVLMRKSFTQRHINKCLLQLFFAPLCW